MTVQTLSEFFQGLALVRAVADIDDAVSNDETGGGNANRASYGTPLWRGTCRVKRMRFADANVLGTKLRWLSQPDQTFLIAPSYGVESTASGVIADIQTDDRRVVDLGQVLPVGTRFSVVFSGSKRSMHEVANVSGSLLEVFPPLPFEVAVADAWDAASPTIEAFVTERESTPYLRHKADEVSFSWMQFY